jgi:hypothetical protein
MDLAELEVSLTSGLQAQTLMQLLLRKLDQLEAPVLQLLEVGQLFTILASPPDQTLSQWEQVNAKVQRMQRGLPLQDSKIIYDALLQTSSPSAAANRAKSK